MSLAKFLTELFAEGRVAVPAPGELGKDDLAAATAVLERQDQLARGDLPDDVPALDPESALQAAQQFYRACQLAMFRDFGEDEIGKLSQSAIEPVDQTSHGAKVHYSVDLTFRFLSELARIVRAAAPDDPLATLLVSWGQRWPLSSIGMEGIGDDVELGPIVESPGLMTMYVDRVVARGDVARAKSEPVRRALGHALGLYTNLAPAFATVLSAEPEGVE